MEEAVRFLVRGSWWDRHSSVKLEAIFVLASLGSRDPADRKTCRMTTQSDSGGTAGAGYLAMTEHSFFGTQAYADQFGRLIRLVGFFVAIVLVLPFHLALLFLTSVMRCAGTAPAAMASTAYRL